MVWSVESEVRPQHERREAMIPSSTHQLSSPRQCAARLFPCIIALVVLACGPRTTWSVSVRSPDGYWLATARSLQWGGPGNAFGATEVYLKQGRHDPVQILGFSHQQATMTLSMTWVGRRHLEVQYGPSPQRGDTVSVDLQMVRLADVQITLRPAPAAAQAGGARGAPR